MSNKLIGVIEDNNFDVQVQITERGLPGKDGYTPIKGIDYFDGYTPVKSLDYMTVEDINEIKEDLQLDFEIETATIEEIQRLF